MYLELQDLEVAAKMVYTDFDEKIEHMYQLKERLAEGFLKLPDVLSQRNGDKRRCTSDLKRQLSGREKSKCRFILWKKKGIYVSAGSACSSHKRKGR